MTWFAARRVLRTDPERRIWMCSFCIRVILDGYRWATRLSLAC
jgi:hypothetical protein